MNKAKNVLAVCDTEAEYANGFMEHLNEKQNIPFEVHAFTKRDTLIEYAKGHSIEILLISENAYTEDVQKISTGMKVLLSEGGDAQEKHTLPVVYKYQSCSTVIREVMEHYGSSESAKNKEGNTILKRDTKIIGIYSPVHRVMKTSFAVVLGQILSKNNAVLYLNLENFSGFEQLMQTTYEKNLSELLYFIKQDKSNISYKISEIVHHMQNMDFIPPALSPMDIQETRFEEYDRIFSALINESSYERIILDIGDGVQDIFRILTKCDRIFVPVREDMISKAKIAQFESTAKDFGFQGLLSNTRKIQIPYHSVKKNGQQFFEDLLYSELGDFSRELLRKEPF